MVKKRTALINHKKITILVNQLQLMILHHQNKNILHRKIKIKKNQ